MKQEDIENNFKYHELLENTQKRYAEISAQAKTMAAVINSLCPESREKSLALTNLEQAMMWANASIARNIK